MKVCTYMLEDILFEMVKLDLTKMAENSLFSRFTLKKNVHKIPLERARIMKLGQKYS